MNLFDWKRKREETARDAALSVVVENAGEDWKADAMDVFRGLSGELTGEDIRLACRERGVLPHHPNAWGGFIAGLVRAGQLEPTGRYRQMTSKGSHARETKIYRKSYQ